MQTNVSDLLRNFTKIRRLVLSGERVVIKTREGNLVLTAERPLGSSLFGKMQSGLDSSGLTPSDSGADPADWTPSL